MLSKQQRADMVSKGMNPLNPAEVNAYLSGKKNSSAANIERMKILMGDKITQSIGHGNERDKSASSLVGQEMNESMNMNSEPEKFDPRAAIARDMQGYADVGGSSDFSNVLQSLNETPRQPAANVQELQSTGNKLATAYYNAFINSLKNPGTQSNIAVYKALKSLLEYEGTVKNQLGDKARGVLTESINNVTKAMYNNLKK